MPKTQDPNLLVGTETHDDAGVYRLTDEIALVQTLDFFPPVVNDPYIYGQVAAANALSDVYAMGGIPKTALNLVGYPDNEDPEFTWLGDILRGGAERMAKAGCVILGGHTVRDAEIKFGYAVTGIVHPKKVLTNATAQPGDVLLLTKPLGTGFLNTAHKKGELPDELFRHLCASMIQLNDIGRDVALEFGAHALTDVTGFGLAGHTKEMAEGCGHTIVISVSRLPIFPGAEPFGAGKYTTRASKSNSQYVADSLEIRGTPNPLKLPFFYDPQTSGGMLIALPADRAEAAAKRALERGAIVAAVIGEITPRQGTALVLTE